MDKRSARILMGAREHLLRRAALAHFRAHRIPYIGPVGALDTDRATAAALRFAADYLAALASGFEKLPRG